MRILEGCAQPVVGAKDSHHLPEEAVVPVPSPLFLYPARMLVLSVHMMYCKGTIYHNSPPITFQKKLWFQSPPPLFL